MLFGKRARLFIENFLVYGLTGVLGKMIPVFMLPLVTRLVPDASIYGVSDLLRVLVSFASAFAVLGMYDAMFRTFFDDDSLEYKKKVCSSAFGVVMASSFVIGTFIIIFSGYLSEILFSSDRLHSWVVLMGVQTFLSGFDAVIAAPTRMQNQRKVFMATSVLLPLISYGASIPLIVYIDPLFGLVMGGFLAAAAKLAIFGWLNRKWFSLAFFDKKLASDMLKIGLPLVPGFFIYWIYTSVDRLMITRFLGTEQNGLYAVGAKIAQVSQFIYMAFAGGWQYFAFSTMKDKDHTQLMSRVFEALGVLSVVSFFLLLPFVDFIFLFVAHPYRAASVVFPYLYISPLLLMLFQTVGNQFLVVKKAYISVFVLALGAVVNIAMNYVLIPRMGIEGAALATALGYSVSLIIAFAVVRKMGLIYGNWRESIVFLSVAGGFIMSKQLNSTYSIVIVSLVCIGIIILVYLEIALLKFKKYGELQ